MRGESYNAFKYGDIIEIRGTHAVNRNLVGNPTNLNILRSVVGQKEEPTLFIPATHERCSSAAGTQQMQKQTTGHTWQSIWPPGQDHKQSVHDYFVNHVGQMGVLA